MLSALRRMAELFTPNVGKGYISQNVVIRKANEIGMKWLACDVLSHC